MAFLFLTVQSLLFQNNSNPDVAPNKPIYYFYWKYEILVPSHK